MRLYILAVGLVLTSCGGKTVSPAPEAPPADDAGTSTAQLVSGQASWLAADSANVYWTDGARIGSVMQAPVAGGPPVTLASGRNSPATLAVDATSVYWTEAGGVMKAPIGGGTITTLFSGPLIGALAVDSTSAYFGTGGNLLKVSIDGGTPTTLATGSPTVGLIAVDSVNVYFVDNAVSGMPAGYVQDDKPATLSKMSVGGGSVTVLATLTDTPSAIAVDSTNVYVAIGEPPSNPYTMSVLAVPIAGGAPTTLASGQDTVSVLAADGTSVYWTVHGGKGMPGAGSVVSVPVAGGTLTTLATGLTQPFGMAVNASSLFWADEPAAGAGRIMALTPK